MHNVLLNEIRQHKLYYNRQQVFITEKIKILPFSKSRLKFALVVGMYCPSRCFHVPLFVHDSGQTAIHCVNTMAGVSCGSIVNSSFI